MLCKTKRAPLNASENNLLYTPKRTQRLLGKNLTLCAVYTTLNQVYVFKAPVTGVVCIPTTHDKFDIRWILRVIYVHNAPQLARLENVVVVVTCIYSGVYNQWDTFRKFG